MRCNGQNTLYLNISKEFSFLDDVSDLCQVWPYLDSKGLLN